VNLFPLCTWIGITVILRDFLTMVPWMSIRCSSLVDSEGYPVRNGLFAEWRFDMGETVGVFAEDRVRMSETMTHTRFGPINNGRYFVHSSIVTKMSQSVYWTWGESYHDAHLLPLFSRRRLL
jgi:hypothetical protein